MSEEPQVVAEVRFTFGDDGAPIYPEGWEETLFGHLPADLRKDAVESVLARLDEVALARREIHLSGRVTTLTEIGLLLQNEGTQC